MTTSDIFAPKKSVIVDRFGSDTDLIVTVTMLLILKNDSLGSDTIAWLMGSLIMEFSSQVRFIPAFQQYSVPNARLGTQKRTNWP